MKPGADAQGDGEDAQPDDRGGPETSRWWRSGRDLAPEAVPPRAVDGEHRQLLADVGHELKSPLSIVLALCTRLETAGRLDGEDAEDVARIRANAYSMLRRVQDLMLMARLESPEQQLEAAVIDVGAIVRACVDGFASVAAQRGMDLQVEVPDALPAMADEEKVVSLVSNLVANAIRHARTRVTVRCSVTAAAGRMTLEVADDGPGVAPDQRETIFERYRRGTRSSGTGLGLAIVSEIAVLHGGSVAVGDAPEGGALFTVELPLRTASATLGTVPGPPRSLALADRQRPIVEELRGELDSAPGRA
ncbi:MAG: sensor histidine kinase [Conexibacter sp.]|nr:sensor histidine kinase [Conexibacter sp.]